MKVDMSEGTEWAISPSMVMQLFVGILLGSIGFFAKGAFDRMEEDMAVMQLDVRQLRNDITALEIGLRGDRFTRTDWQREKAEIDADITEIREELESIRDQS